MLKLDTSNFTKQVIDFQKAAFNNAFNAMITIQDQTEKIVKDFYGDKSIIPEEAKKQLAEWSKSVKEGQENFKKTIDENFKKLENFFIKAENKETE